MAQRVLVTGGTGLIGGEVILALARQGIEVDALVRGTTPAHAGQRLEQRLRKSHWFDPVLLSRIRVLPGDTTSPGFGIADGLIQPVDSIVHCAANTEFSDRQSEDVWRTNVSGAEMLVGFARAHAPSSRVIFVSTASVTTGPHGALVNEDAAFQGHENPYTLSKRAAEAVVRSSGLDTVILRPAIVLSRGIEDEALARSILWAVPIMREIGEVPVDPASHIDIVPVDYTAECIAAVVRSPSLKRRLYHISAGQTAESFREILAAIADECPEYRVISPIGTEHRARKGFGRLMRPLKNYLPFINADIRYANERLLEDFSGVGLPVLASSYVPTLVATISLAEALSEMFLP